MKTVYVKAYTQLNLGDDLFIHILCDRYKEVEFTLICNPKEAIAFSNVSNLHTISPPKYIDSILYRMGTKLSYKNWITNRVARKSDATVHIGGSVFIQRKNKWTRPVVDYKSLVKNSNNFFVIGSNFGPYYNEDYYETFSEIFEKIEDICFRDNKSYNLFSKMDNTRLAPDVVFTLKDKEIATIENTNDKYIVISVIDLSIRDELSLHRETYENSITDISKKLIEEGFHVVLMSFCSSEGDGEAVQRLEKKVDNSNLSTFYYTGNLEKALSIIKSSNGVVATRFHSLILAWMFNKPVFPFVYSSKTSNVIKDIGFDEYYLEISDLKKLDVSRVVTQLKNQIPLDIQTEAKEANKQFLKLDEYLKKGKMNEFLQ